MWVKDRFGHRSSFDLQILFLLSSTISLSPLHSFLVLVHLWLPAGEPRAQSSDLQFFHYISSRLYQQDRQQWLYIPMGWSGSLAPFAALFQHSALVHRSVFTAHIR